jgi:hypothetical protein
MFAADVIWVATSTQRKSTMASDGLRNRCLMGGLRLVVSIRSA